MIGDMNEHAARPAAVQMVPRVIPVTILRDGVAQSVDFHTLSDADLEQFVAQDAGGEGWRWARSIAWLLAGNAPRSWSRPEGT